MKYLTAEATDAYIWICRVSLFHGVIGPETFLARMNTLRQLCNPGSAQLIYLNKLLQIEGWENQDEWTDELRHEVDIYQNSKVEIFLQHDVGTETSDELLVLHFISSALGMTGWEFHKGDADPYPSVPHGHSLNDSRLKLDVYQGYMTRKGEPKGRVSRELTIRLWNDEKFRTFAEEAIEFFLAQRIGRSWIVKNPRKLPKRRRIS